ncbi:RNA-directed DNA polymerase [Gammaproteobacteria bacterium]
MSSDIFGLNAVYGAYRACRRRKRGTRNAQRYETSLLDRLVDTEHALTVQSWRPSRTIAFVVRKPKAREILAADFSDRVVHHLLVPRLEQHFEPVFIHDSYSNRLGKGTHAAVERLQTFLRQASNNGQRPAHYLQLDIANYFNTINRRHLYGLIRDRLERDVRRPVTDSRHVDEAIVRDVLWLTRTILTGNAAQGARYRGQPEDFRRLPPHKRLINAAPECGLPIGNLTSQFFANVYLNELDQYVKHTLKCRHYLRYVDDMVLVDTDPEQLVHYRDAIEHFIGEKLGLRLRDMGRLRPASDGVDFLGYIVRHDYCLVRRRVVGNLSEKLKHYEQRIVRRDKIFRLPSNVSHPSHHGIATPGFTLNLLSGEREALRATLASYLGHFRHANSYRLVAALRKRHAWLDPWLDITPDGQMIPRWEPPSVSSLRGQWRWFKHRFPNALIFIQVGNCLEVHGQDAKRIATLENHGGKPVQRPFFTESGWSWPLARAANLTRRLNRLGWSRVDVSEEGWLKGGMKRRVLRRWAGAVF